ncbi:hypothetical protein WN944_012130 [Citrus x changshan-huyou]|uniref:B box-type domain-containing protein n=1 Tax=Citrus x changshan-huyou TaxID=2935761 RepID=A0AAP0MZD3_9ROSI|nr:zinc finger protein CONSTANS-LIKE 4 isoform X2 [Citrus sinensis]KAH9748365.1 B box-type domain-containing protein [Citrus sinensis]
MKKCELCGSPAKMFCESDQASLCWDCDTKVHGANFLVAKHSRTLLCHVCQSLTPWNGSGPKLGPTISVCNVCVGNGSGSTSREETNRGETYTDDDYDDANEEDDDDDDDDDGGDEDDDDDDDEENQVVPWSSTPPPQVSSSSTSDQEFASKFCNGGEGTYSESQMSFSLKHVRNEITKFHSRQDYHQGYSSSSQQSKNPYF